MALNSRRLAANAPNRVARLIHLWEARLVAPYEARIPMAFDLCLAIGEKDRAELQAAGARGRILLNPHGVNFDHLRPPEPGYPKGKNVVLTGNLGYSPNADAVRYFVRQILPLIRHELVEVKFLLPEGGPRGRWENLRRKKGYRFWRMSRI